ncbi:4'-phosphopantetheinyl transferase family protein [Desulfovibrio sp.]|uniref:4'-phosphopantetheinyl transferase family protein n=1 Tax=Desulfovibrio sp. TaxID=885 RepID=UPI0039E5F0CB
MKIVVANVYEVLGASTALLHAELKKSIASAHHNSRIAHAFRQANVCLSLEEQQKALRFRFARDSLLYAHAHALLRHELSNKHPETKPAAWHFCAGNCGKPYLTGRYRPLWFNLSHAWPFIAVLTCSAGRCGVDIECAKTPPAYNEISKHALHADEHAAVHKSSKPGTLFLQYWTMKEAVCKAIGCGMPRGFPALRVQPDFQTVILNGRRLFARLASTVDATAGYVLAGCCLTRRTGTCEVTSVRLECLGRT